MPKSTKIIVVEDIRDTAETWQVLLKMHGYEPRIAFDAETALRFFAEEVPDLMLCDIAMPKMSGNDLVKTLREKPEAKDVLFIAMSGFGNHSHRAAAMAAGFEHFFVKPVNIDRVMALLENIERTT